MTDRSEDPIARKKDATKRKDYALAWALGSLLVILLALNVWFDMRNPEWAVIDVLAMAVAAVLLFRKYRRDE